MAPGDRTAEQLAAAGATCARPATATERLSALVAGRTGYVPCGRPATHDWYGLALCDDCADRIREWSP